MSSVVLTDVPLAVVMRTWLGIIYFPTFSTAELTPCISFGIYHGAWGRFLFPKGAVLVPLGARWGLPWVPASPRVRS